MPDGISTDELFAKAKPSGVSTDDLFKQSVPAPNPSPGVSTDELFAKANEPGLLDRFKSWGEDQKSQAAAQAVAAGVRPDIAQAVSNGPFPSHEDIKQSPVGKVLEVLNIPQNVVVGASVRALDKLSPGIQKALNPANEYVPDLIFSDIVNYYTPTPDEVGKKYDSNAVQAAYWTARTGVGLAASIFGDPLFFMGPKVGALTKESEAAYKVGETANLERNALSLNYPFTNKPLVEVPAKPIVEGVKSAASKTASVIEKVPGGSAALEAGKKAVQTAYDVVDSFNPWTGDIAVDSKRAVHSALQRGDRDYIERFILENAQPKFTEAEKSVIRNVVESTPNLQTGGAIADLKIAESVGPVAKKMGVAIAPGRDEAIAKSVSSIKIQNAADIEERVTAGLINKADLAQKTIENYLVHKISDQGRAYLMKNPALAAAIEEAGVTRKVEQSLNGKTVSSFDTGKFRRGVRGSLDEANAIMKEKTGVNGFFIDDPILATAMKRSETRKLIRDKQLLESLSERAVRPKTAMEARLMEQNGYQRINHPEFEGKTLIIKEGENVQKVKLQDLMFPKNIAQKVSYDIVPRGGGMMGSVNAFMDSYNRVFRSFALFKPDYYAENWIDNLLKNYVVGVKLEDYSDAAKVMSYMISNKLLRNGPKGAFDATDKLLGKTIYSMLPGKEAITVAGKSTPIRDVVKLMETYNINTGGHFTEGLDKVLFTGKKVASEQTLAGKAGAAYANSKEMVTDVLRTMHLVGERGENLTRMALFLNRIKTGFNAEMATYEVEKFLFDFKRTTQTMDAVRRYYNPFIQAAFKTGFVGPELVATKPYVVNAYENTLMRTLQSSFNDPVTSWSVQQLYPDYYRMHDRIAGPLLPGNHWLAALAGYGPDRAQRLPFTVALGLPGGASILNQFMVWDSQVLKQTTSTSPVLRSFTIMLTGKDPWTSANVDIMKNTPDFAKRMNWAISSFLKGAVAMPNAEKMIYQRMGIVDQNYIEPESILAFHGAMGKFGRVTDLSKEYLNKIMFLASVEKDLRGTLRSTVANEIRGKTEDIALAGSIFKPLVGAMRRPFNSNEVWQMITKTRADLQTAQIASGVLSKDINPATVAGMIRNVQSTAKELNKSYQVLMQNYFNMAKEAREAQLKQFTE